MKQRASTALHENGATDSFETSVGFERTVQCQVAEDREPQILRVLGIPLLSTPVTMLQCTINHLVHNDDVFVTFAACCIPCPTCINL
jgi:hypothetical protein